MKEESFLKVLNNFIGHKIGLYTNNESFVEGYLIDVKNDHFVIQVGPSVFYFAIDNLYAISKNAKRSKSKEKGAPYKDKVFFEDIINGFKYRWVTIISSSSQIFTGLLTRTTDDYVLLINKDENYFIQKSIITSIAEGEVEEEFNQKKTIEMSTSSKSELIEKNKTKSTLTGVVGQEFDQKKSIEMPTSYESVLTEINNNVSELISTSEIIGSTIEEKEPQEVISQKNSNQNPTLKINTKNSMEMPTSFESGLTENNNKVPQLISTSGIIGSTIEEQESQEVISQMNSVVDKAISSIYLSQNVNSANHWTSHPEKEKGYQNPTLKMNTNKEECHLTPIVSIKTLKNHDQQECTPGCTKTNKIENNCTKPQYPREQKNLFGIQHLSVTFILLILILSTHSTNKHIF